MAEAIDPRKVEAQADERVRQILAAAASWAKELPAPLAPAVRAVCIRLGEMVADQRHYLAPLPEPQESERSAVLTLLAQRLASTAVSSGLEKELQTLSEMELKSTGSWALVPGAQAEWITTAVRYLESASERLPPSERPDPYFAEDVVAGVIVSVRAVVGIDELHARTEARYSGGVKIIREEEQE
ncbi:MAG TPA: hypothetical protein VMJ30_08950 [Gemmatimonadales bacterium]|nr:hypothetical protein [Gemmatimonadales bacterium]